MSEQAPGTQAHDSKTQTGQRVELEPTVSYDRQGRRIETTSAIDPQTQALVTEKRRFRPDNSHDLFVRSTENSDGSIDHLSERYFQDGGTEVRHQSFDPGAVAGDRPIKSHSELRDQNGQLNREQGHYIDPETGDECTYNRQHQDEGLLLGIETRLHPETRESSRIITSESRLNPDKVIRLEEHNSPSTGKKTKVATEWLTSSENGEPIIVIDRKAEVRLYTDPNTGEAVQSWQNLLNHENQLLEVEVGEERTDPTTKAQTRSVRQTPIEKPGYRGGPGHLEYPELSVTKIADDMWKMSSYGWSLNQEGLDLPSSSELPG